MISSSSLPLFLSSLIFNILSLPSFIPFFFHSFLSFCFSLCLLLQDLLSFFSLILEGDHKVYRTHILSFLPFSISQSLFNLFIPSFHLIPFFSLDLHKTSVKSIVPSPLSPFSRLPCLSLVHTLSNQCHENREQKDVALVLSHYNNKESFTKYATKECLWSEISEHEHRRIGSFGRQEELL